MTFCKECGNEIETGANFCPNCGTSVSSYKETYNSNASQTNESTNFQTMKRKEAAPYGAFRLENLPEGFVIDDRYEIKSKLGQGGFGAVYLAYDKHLEINKALKIIPESVACDREAMSELLSEARTLVTMNNEHIVRVYDLHHTGSIKYIDMEYVIGKPLNELKLDYEDKKLPEEKVKELGLQIAKGLSHAHENRVIHRDIKPQNIMVTNDGLVKIMDFGISEALRTSISRIANTSASTGTLVYMAPEQLKGENIGKESDIYSFGAMLYELLTGNPPFYKGAIEYQILNEKPSPIEDISTNLNEIIMKCLEKNYQNRYISFDDIIQVLVNNNISLFNNKSSEIITSNEIEGSVADTDVNIYRKKIIILSILLNLGLLIMMLTLLPDIGNRGPYGSSGEEDFIYIFSFITSLVNIFVLFKSNRTEITKNIAVSLNILLIIVYFFLSIESGSFIGFIIVISPSISFLFGINFDRRVLGYLSK